MNPAMHLALVTFLALYSSTASAMTWQRCASSSGTPLIAPTSVILSPDPPIIGSPAVFTITGTSAVEVTSGAVEMAISLSGLDIFAQQLDLCESMVCPLLPGPITVQITQDLPPIAPPGEYGLQLLLRDGETGAELMCLQVDFELVPPEEPSVRLTNVMLSSLAEHPVSR